MRVELHVKSGPAAGKHFYFSTSDCFLFGRAKDAHISLPNDLYVSRQHFFLEISPPLCKLRDLYSKNGVFVNGVRYGGRVPLPKGIKQAPINEVLLKDGDEIIVGDTCVTVSIEFDNSNRKPTAYDAPVRCSLCKKDVSQETQRVKKTSLQRYVCLACREKIVITHGTTPKKMFQSSSETSSTSKEHSKFPQIEGFQIEQKIGQGTMGAVYKARENTSDRLVAIKKFHPQTSLNDEKLRRLQRELFMIQQLRHKHIVQFFGYKKTGNSLYFIFEYVEGITLRKLMLSHQGRVPLEEAIQIFWGSLEGLAFAHRVKISARTLNGNLRSWQGIVHRELSPQNIILSKEGSKWVPKITDFKLYRSFEDAGITSILTPEDLLAAPMYWPREHLTHYKHISPATDVFSLAAIFYEMITGHWVRDGFQALFDRCKQSGCLPSISDYLHVIVTHPPVPIRKRNPNIPEALAKVIDRALKEQELPHGEKEVTTLLRQLRYPDAAAFRDALLQALEQDDRKHETRLPLPKEASPSESSAAEVPDSASIMFSSPQVEEDKEVALLLLDLAHSTEYIANMGDTHFSTLIGRMLTRVKVHPSSSELLFLKGTGDGFLAAFRSLPAAYSLALTYLHEPVAPKVGVRLALHWGRVKASAHGDILGMEVHRVTRIEGVRNIDRAPSETDYDELPQADRILITSAGRQRLTPQIQQRFQAAGAFQMSGFHEACELWVLSKKYVAPPQA
ncbi:MAG: protein kinase [bacterium]|nr:protein kinase [bacterium]